MLRDDGLNRFFGLDVLFVVCLDEHIANIRIFDLSLCNLNLGASLVLESADRFTILAND